MRPRFMPKSRLGKWSVGLGVVLASLMVLELIFALAIGGDSAAIDGNPTLTILVFALSIAVTFIGPIPFIIGIISIIKYKDWLIFKSLVGLYILVILLFVFGEFLFPH